jgi:hypothetical protein
LNLGLLDAGAGREREGPDFNRLLILLGCLRWILALLDGLADWTGGDGAAAFEGTGTSAGGEEKKGEQERTEGTEGENLHF